MLTKNPFALLTGLFQGEIGRPYYYDRNCRVGRMRSRAIPLRR